MGERRSKRQKKSRGNSKRDGSWNKKLIYDSFHPGEAEMILSIPREGPDMKMRLFGVLSQKGSSSVKSTYHLATNLDRKNEASGSELQFKILVELHLGAPSVILFHPYVILRKKE